MMENHAYRDPELPHYMRGAGKGFTTHFYINGDEHYQSKSLLVNPKRYRNFDTFLDDATKSLNPRFGAIRNVYTPLGKHKITNFDDLREDGQYVAAGVERYKKIGKPYTAIESHSPRPSKINKSNFNSRIEPVVHSRIRQDARFRQSQTLASRAKRITVAINNDDIDHSHVVLIPAKKVNNLQAIIETIDDDLNNNRGIQFRVEYLVDTDTEEVCTHPEDIIEDHIYVACNKGRRYIPKTYSKDGRKNFVVIPSPRPLQRPKFIWERSNLNGSRDNKRPRTLPPIGSKNYKGSPDNSVTSNPEYGSRKKPHQANGAIHTKPQKHKRTPEKKAKQTDYDKDDGGVFKAKDTNKHTKGAREVGETKDTRTDLPIDQVPAEEVKEETLYEEENTAKVPSEITLTHKQSAEGEEDDEIYDHHDDHYDDDDDEDEKIKSQKTPKAPQNSNKDKNSKTSTKPDKKETTHKTNSKTNNNNTNNNNTNNKTNNNNNTNNKTNPKPADHSHGAKDPAPKKHSGTRGEFNNVSPLPGIGKNDTNRSSTPVGRNGFDSPTQQEKDLAAAKIQANYRGHKTRQELAKQKEGTKKNDAANKPPDTKKDAASKPPDTKKDAGKKPESKTKEDEAATKIQAGFRGHKTRQDLKKQKENQQVKDAKKSSVNTGKTASKGNQKMSEEDKAATKIQAGFRGHQTRKELAQKKVMKEDKELDQAATKIQANFRGHKTRKELKKNQPPKDNNKTTKHSSEEEQAATKIQAGFRGHQTRKQLNQQVCYDQGAHSAVVIKSVKLQSSNLLDYSKFNNEVEDEENELRLIEIRQKAVTDLQVCLKAILKRGFRWSSASTGRWSLGTESVSKIEFDNVDIAKFKAKQIFFGFVTFFQSSFRSTLLRKAVEEREEMMKEREKEKENERKMKAIEAPPDLDMGVSCDKNTKISGKQEQLKMANDFESVKVDAITIIELCCKDCVHNIKMKDKVRRVDGQNILQSHLKMFLSRLAVKNRLVRKEMLQAKSFAQEEVWNIFQSLEDREIAAKKIQAGYRGMVIRKKLSEASPSGNVKNVSKIDIGKTDALKTLQMFCKNYVHRMRMHNETKKKESQNILQSNFRMFLTRLTVKNRLVRKEMLQTRSLAQEEVLKIFHSMQQREVAATKIQTGYRGMVARKHLCQASTNAFPLNKSMAIGNLHPNLKPLKMKHESKTESQLILQSNFRMFLTRFNIKNRLLRKGMLHAKSLAQEAVLSIIQSLEEREFAAAKIQAGYRGMVVRKKLSRASVVKSDETLIKSHSDLVTGNQNDISSFYKDHSAKENDINDRNSIRFSVTTASTPISVVGAKSTLVNNNAVLEVQSACRSYFTRKLLEQNVAKNKVPIDTKDLTNEDQDLQSNAAKVIQAGFRGHWLRKKLGITKSKKLKGDNELVREIVNGHKRGKNVQRHDWGPLTIKQHEQDVAVTKIQACYRGYKIRKGISMVKSNSVSKQCVPTIVIEDFTDRSNSHLSEILVGTEIMNRKDTMDIKQKAASKIQAHFKGYSYRKRARSANQVLGNDLNDPRFILFQNKVTVLQAAIRSVLLKSKEDTFDDGFCTPPSFTPPHLEFEKPTMRRVSSSYPNRLSNKRQMNVPQNIQIDEYITLLQSACKGLVTRATSLLCLKKGMFDISTSGDDILGGKLKDNARNDIQSRTFVLNDEKEQTAVDTGQSSDLLTVNHSIGTENGSQNVQVKVVKDIQTRPVKIVQRSVVFTAEEGVPRSLRVQALGTQSESERKPRPKSSELKRTLPILPTPFILRSKTEIFGKDGTKRKTISKEMLGFSFSKQT